MVRAAMARVKLAATYDSVINSVTSSCKFTGMPGRGFALYDMERFATEAWGPLGAQTVQKWAEFNERFFDGKLRPIPVMISRTLPFGKLIGARAYNPGTHGRTITLNVPKNHNRLVADNATLLEAIASVVI